MTVQELLTKLERAPKDVEVKLAAGSTAGDLCYPVRIVYEVCYLDGEQEDVLVISA